MGKKRAHQPGYKQVKDMRGYMIWVSDGSDTEKGKHNPATGKTGEVNQAKGDFAPVEPHQASGIDTELLDEYDIPYHNGKVDVHQWAQNYGYTFDDKGQLINKDGYRAVAYSPGYGAGWSTWNNVDPIDGVANLTIATLKEYYPDSFESHSAELEEFKEAEKSFRTIYSGIKERDEDSDDFYTGGLFDVQFRWMDKDTKIRVQEYDGFESIYTQDSDVWY